MKIKIIFTTRYHGTEDDVFYESSAKELQGELVTILNTNNYYSLSWSNEETEVEVIGIHHTQGTLRVEEDFKSFAKQIIETFCPNFSGKTYLLFHAGDLPGADFGLYNGWNDLFKELYPQNQIEIRGFKHQDSEFGGYILKRRNYAGSTFSVELLYKRVQAIFLLDHLKEQWEEYYHDRTTEKFNSIFQLLEEMNKLADVIPIVDLEEFKKSDDYDVQENLISVYIDQEDPNTFFNNG